jgi:membrane dipeptidase
VGDDDSDKMFELWMKRRGEADCTIDTVVDHIMHLVEKMGAEHVGIGSDFDGADRLFPIGLE